MADDTSGLGQTSGTISGIGGIPDLGDASRWRGRWDLGWCTFRHGDGRSVDRGNPQCHIVAVSEESGVPAAIVGCALSRQRTGMRPVEMTCALRGPQLDSIVAAVQRASEVDAAVGRYAAVDARRFT